MKNVFTTTALAAALALAAATARADRAITYHGKLVPTGSAKISTKVPMPMEFRLYRRADVGETTALWGRRVSVRFDEGGLFYVELCDGSGTELDRTEYRRLADALASVGGADDVVLVTIPVGREIVGLIVEGLGENAAGLATGGPELAK